MCSVKYSGFELLTEPFRAPAEPIGLRAERSIIVVCVSVQCQTYGAECARSWRMKPNDDNMTSALWPPCPVATHHFRDVHLSHGYVAPRYASRESTSTLAAMTGWSSTMRVIIGLYCTFRWVSRYSGEDAGRRFLRRKVVNSEDFTAMADSGRFCRNLGLGGTNTTCRRGPRAVCSGDGTAGRSAGC